MSSQITGHIKSHLADAAITVYTIVKSTSTGSATATADTDKILGVAQLSVLTAEMVPVQFNGTAKVLAGGTITKGDWITATTAGKAAATSTTGKVVLGQALESAVLNDVFEVQLGIFVL